MKLRPVLSAWMLVSIAVAGCASVERGNDRLERELDDITRLWSGRYVGLATLPAAVGGGTSRIIHEIASIDAPQFGERVFSYMLRRDAHDGPILQQKIFSFDTDPARERNRMRAWVFSREQFDPALAGTPTTWRELQPGQLMGFPVGCTFGWRRTRSGFTGAVSSKDCQFDSRSFAQSVRAEMSYDIDTDALIWTETLSGADGGVLATTGGALRAERVGPVVDVRREAYRVRGAAAAEVRRDLYASTPIVVDGEPRDALTSWSIVWDAAWEESESSCRVGAVSTSVTIFSQLPRLANRGTVSPEVLAAWDDYVAELLRQELRQRQFAVAAALRIEASLADLSEYPACEPAAAAAERLAREMIGNARRRALQYDYATRNDYADEAVFQRSRLPD